MLCSRLVFTALVLGSAIPASAQYARPLAGPAVPSYNPGVPSYNPGVPSYNPGVPSYNPGVPRQAPGAVLGNPPVARSAPGAPPAQRRAYGPGFVPYGAQTVIVAPPPLPRRSTMDNPFYGDLGEPFF